MNTLKITKYDVSGRNYTPYLLFGLCLLLWPLLQWLVMSSDPTIGFIDPNIWLLILLSLISFLMVIGLCWWLLQRFWMRLGLPLLSDMVLQFKKLELWQQLGFYWASFALLLLAAIGVLTAIV
ncbi:MAG: hypothetical protein P0Y49_10855 [Candidatus Pedobacter colombiensis]|uniref:Uncharacterized protein n=1 Tax=Candidatus Pedobacter colombiensis TaxID=3121371 RepID=A0AAJ5WC93_9SPHI|nr:hypothetical protein [Pedobacter sp.]WEK21635.1 MAG: hypothetical protein P0Y49_10855 [Pedobacter sp.]